MIVDLPHTVTSSLYSTFFLPLSHPLFFIKSATPQQATGNHQVDSLVDIDPAELLKVGEFQKELQKGGILYTTFGSATELEKLLHISLTKIALSWTASQPKDDSSKPVSSEAASQNEEDADDEEELGLLDYLERSEEGMNAASEGISQIGDALSEMTGSIAERTEAMTAAKGPDGQIPVKLVRLLSNQAADDMVRFTKLATPMLDSTEGSFEEAIDAITQALTVQKAYSDAQTSEDDINDLSNTLDGFLTSIAQADQGMESMRKAVLSLPKLSARFNRARKELLAFLDGYSRMSTRLKSLTSNVLQTLRSINQP